MSEISNNINPFIDKTQVEYSLLRSFNVHIAVYTTLGSKVRSLSNERRNAGHHTITWDGKDNNAGKFPSGFYFLRLEAGEYKGTRKLHLLR